MFEVTIEETFAAGHALRNYKGKCENVHGHNYRCQVSLAGETLDEIGLLVDFVELKKAVHAVIDRMDHQWLNDLPPFDKLNPRPKTWPASFTTKSKRLCRRAPEWGSNSSGCGRRTPVAQRTAGRRLSSRQR